MFDTSGLYFRKVDGIVTDNKNDYKKYIKGISKPNYNILQYFLNLICYSFKLIFFKF